MQTIVSAERLEVSYITGDAAEILVSSLAGNGLAGGLTLTGSSAERLAFLSDWVAAELAQADMYDPDTLTAVRPILVAFQGALGVDIDIA